MKYISCMLFLLTACTVFAQNSGIHALYGQRYIGQTGALFYILNDTQLVSNLNPDGDTANYWVREDTIFTRHQFDTSGKAEIEYFKIAAASREQFRLVAYGISGNDVAAKSTNYIFTNASLLEAEVSNFESCTIEHMGPFWGYSKLTVFRDGRMAFFYDPYHWLVLNYSRIDTGRTKGWQKGRSTKSMRDRFMACLKTANIQGKNYYRYGCGLDAHYTHFTLRMNGKTYYSLGCSILPQQQELMQFYAKILEQFIHYERWSSR